MSSSGRRRSNTISLSPSKTPHFFKIILEDTIREGKLGLPRDFVKKSGRSLPSLVILKVPTGAVWPVELAKRDGKFWFQNGWQEFAGYYSLDYGHMLVFEYDGCSHFHVIIFDKSATEIKYPCDDTNCSEELKHAGEKQKPKVRRKARERSPLPCPFPHKKARNGSTVHGNSTSMSVPHSRRNHFTREVPHEVEGVKVSCKRELGVSASGWRRPKTNVEQRLTNQEKIEALRRTSGFRSANPHFKIVMQPSYVSFRFDLVIPAEFGEIYMKKKRSDVDLCVSDGRIWPAKYSKHEFQSNPKIYYGWEKFARDNGLRVGDVCVFELIEIDKMQLKVHIYHADEDLNIYMLQGEKKTSNEDSKPLRGGITFKSENPCCRVFMHPSYVRRGCGMRMPAGFGKKYLPEERSDVTLCTPDGRTWPVEYHRRSYLYKGWQEFVHDNDLEVGDVCFFELIKIFETKLKVSIFRGNRHKS
ncbi:B3 domain-containing transcription factor VRN1-like isoform X2 [Tripterygium wilfordii]|uniref:B3 domain-containing transcription factor VRN1-like isoform X2 n=1 Tax=Tripterygium wilfordii TaxID=458696 RepID=UPI0018F7ECC7|nr:B3 domain-containing transcription factor VRN1-like isoform X2 [Tripterygium wilfordii]